MSRLKPGEDAGNIELDLINGARWKLGEQTNEWNVIVVYRGLHCPVCKGQLQNLKKQLEDYADAGVGVVSASMDTKKRADKAHKDWELGSVPVAFGLERDLVEKFGLYLSDAISDNEPDIFSEPAILLFKGTQFYAGWVQTIPFARPPFDDLLKGIKFIQKEGYPPRGKLG